MPRIKKTECLSIGDKAIKNGLDINEFKFVVNTLSNGKKLPDKYRDHKLSGEWNGYRDCHITPDWVLIYKIDHNELILVLSRTGSHSDLKLC